MRRRGVLITYTHTDIPARRRVATATLLNRWHPPVITCPKCGYKAAATVCPICKHEHQPRKPNQER